jgi:hypothetical protein
MSKDTPIKTEDRIYSILKEETPYVHWERIENGVSVGHPDVHGSYQQQDFYVELKTHTLKEGPLLRPAQYAWMTSRLEKAALSTFVLSGLKDTTKLMLWKFPFEVRQNKEKVEIIEPHFLELVKPYNMAALLINLVKGRPNI